MKLSMDLFILKTACFLFFITKVNSIKCFQCNSVDNPGCNDLESNSTTYLQECEIGKTFCRKLTQFILDNETLRITRECANFVFKTPVDHCLKNDDDFRLETSCQCFKDGCNSSSKLTGTILLPNLALIFIIKLLF